MKIATHNSCTGEKGKGLLSWLVTPFSKCQSKTLEEQFHAGCRMFDIRVKFSKDDGIEVRHGAWLCSLTFDQVLYKLFTLKRAYNETIYLRIMYEGNIEDEYTDGYFVRLMQSFSKGFVLVDIFNKHPYRRIWSNPNADVAYTEAFVGLPVKWGRWEWLLPIPWLWKKLRYNTPVFDDYTYKVVDFL